MSDIIKKKRGGYRPSMKRYPLTKIEQRDDGYWYAVYGDGSEYRHDTEQECRQLHPDTYRPSKRYNSEKKNK